jgi:hypothetical protein
MTKMQDTEGEKIPCDERGREYFDVDIFDYGDGSGPMISMNVPCLFRGEDGGEYNSQGVVHAPIRQVLEDYMKSVEKDGGCCGDFASWLRDYADRLDAALKKRNAN